MLFDWNWRRYPGLVAVLAVAAGLLAGLSGCGGGGSDEPAESANSAGDASGDQRSSGERRPSGGNETPGSSAGSRGGQEPGEQNGLVRTDADGRKWIEDIPLDVWYDEPLLTYTDNAHITAAGPGAPAGAGGPGGAAGPMPGTPAANGGTTPTPPDNAGNTPSADPAGTDWSELIPAAVLDAESKSLRNQLTSAMQTVATYNNAMQAIQWDGATLCAVAGIAIEHPEPLSWKDKAPQIRDLAQKIEEAAQERGRSAFEATQIPFEQMISVFSGNDPAGLEPAEPSVPFAQSASRGGIMRRMQESFDWLSKNINSADRLNDAANKDQLVLETSVLAALTKVVSVEGYDSAGEPDYAQEAKSLVQDALDARSAAQAGSYDAFREAVDRMGTRCNNCHTNYRFE